LPAVVFSGSDTGQRANTPVLTTCAHPQPFRRTGWRRRLICADDGGPDSRCRCSGGSRPCRLRRLLAVAAPGGEGKTASAVRGRRRRSRLDLLDVRLAPNGRLFYIADLAAGGVWKLDGRRFRILGFDHTGAGAHGLVVSRDAKLLYVTNRNAGSVSVISFKTTKVIRTWPLPGGGSPDMGGVSADGRVRGYRRIQGELVGLGIKLAASTVWTILKEAGIEPAPKRLEQNWSEFLRAQAASILECDFLTVDTLFLKRFYALFFIELATRRVHLAGITTNPDGRWVTQQARNLLMELGDKGIRPRFLVRDRDSTFTCDFDEVFRSEGIRVIKAPVQAPTLGFT
jgi:YVTN family beta-propeller protein